MTLVLPWLMLTLLGGAIYLFSRRHAPADSVAENLLKDAYVEEVRADVEGHRVKSVDKTRFRAWVMGAIFFVVAGYLVGIRDFRVVAFMLLGAAAGELYYRGRKEKQLRLQVKRMEFFLPTAMERIVMAVGSGLDIIPALAEASRKSSDPVSEIFRRIVSLADNGLRVEQVLRLVADEVPSSSVKHALIHLGLAYKQGGEVVRPLKELSDATQAQYQETVEEEIAKLPVKAVLPLVLTFAGLIVCFLTVPILQVSTSLEKISHAAK